MKKKDKNKEGIKVRYAHLDGRVQDLDVVYSPEGFIKASELANEKERKILDKAESILMKYGLQFAPFITPHDEVKILDQEEYDKEKAKISTGRKITDTGNTVMRTFLYMKKNEIIDFEQDITIINHVREIFDSNQRGLSESTLRDICTEFNKGL